MKPDLDRTTLLKLRELDAKATPGPWAIEDELRSFGRVTINGAPGHPDVAACRAYNVESGRDLANAELIAAMRNALPSLLTPIESPAPSEAPAEAFTSHTWPRVIIDRDGLRLQQSQPPNSFLEVIRIADGKEIVSQPCVVHDDRSELIMLLFDAYARLVSERHTSISQSTKGENNGKEA